MHDEDATRLQRGVFDARVVANRALCDEHYRIDFVCDDFPPARPGEFVQLLCTDSTLREGITHKWTDEQLPSLADPFTTHPTALIRRAFSIAELDAADSRTTLRVIHRVVGVGTAWLERLRPDDSISMLGPLGNRFRIRTQKPHAYLISGGVGFPPMIWLARALHEAGKSVVSFFGARTERLIPLALPRGVTVPGDAQSGIRGVEEFEPAQAPVVISTDDGSVGWQGYITDAMARFFEVNPVGPDELVVYACGPEPMMRSTARWCESNDIECQVCMERAMACGMGTCQSCVVPCRDANRATGWRYRLCCTDGPVFDSRDVLWDDPATLPAG